MLRMRYTVDRKSRNWMVYDHIEQRYRYAGSYENCMEWVRDMGA